MTNILELLKSEKVEWKKLGEVVEISKGKQLNKKELLEEGEFPAYNGGKTYSGWTDKYNVEGDTIIISQGGASAGYVNYIECKFWANAHCYYINKNSKVNNRYIFHLLKMNEEYFMQSQYGSGIPALKLEKLKNFEIPIPSLETQEKIVAILDKFTNYVTELQSELQSRTKQYIYYRDMLLSEEYLNKITKEMEEDRRLIYTSLGEIGKFTRGNGLQKKDFQEEGKPVIHYGQIYTKYGFLADKVLTYVNDEIFSKLRKAKKNDILIATTSENVEDVGKSVVWAGEDEIGFSGDMYSYRTEQNSKYIAYYFQTNEFQKQKERKVTGTKMIRIHADDMEKFEIPLPPLSLQNKIVKVLDKFQLLLEDTKGFLPEEIEQRQKQYEYYREKLLTFDIDSDSTHARTIISNLYYDILYKAAELVGIDIKDNLELREISTVIQKTSNINWKEENKEYYYIDLTSVSTKNKKISATELINKDNAPSRAKQIVKGGDVIFGTTRPMQERLALIPSNLDNQICSTGYCILRSDENVVTGKWIYYNLLKTDFYKYVELNQKGASYPAISDSDIKNYKILIPPLHVQHHIVSILNKFDTLVNDIKEGLPKEIEQRQKQYEYWREQLLSFSK